MWAQVYAKMETRWCTFCATTWSWSPLSSWAGLWTENVRLDIKQSWPTLIDVYFNRLFWKEKNYSCSVALTLRIKQELRCPRQADQVLLEETLYEDSRGQHLTTVSLCIHLNAARLCAQANNQWKFNPNVDRTQAVVLHTHVPSRFFQCPPILYTASLFCVRHSAQWHSDLT